MIAVGVGFVVGSVVAVTATSLPTLLSQARKSLPAETISPSFAPSMTPKEVQLNSFAVTSPSDQSVSDSNTLSVVGSAGPSTKILLESESESKIVEASASGTFEGKLKINEGANTLYFTNIAENGQIATETRTVFYTPEEL